jgi:electron transport complex protein RnfC
LSRLSFRGGIHAPHNKNTADQATQSISIPDRLLVPMVQHIGATCTPTVKKGDRVLQGQIIGDSEAFVCAPIHASLSGIVSEISVLLTYGNRPVTTIEIKPDPLEKQAISPSVRAPSINSKEEFLKAVRASGLTGLGGAGFPAHVKLNPPKDKTVDLLIINAAECEPYITSDYRECLENTSQIIEGIQAVLKWTSIPKATIAVEDNKPAAIEALKKAVEKDNRIDVKVLKSMYPQGAEKTLIYSLTGRKIKTGKLPADVGCIVMNVTSVSFLASYLKTGMPLIKKRITIDGPIVKQPGNREAYIGTPISQVIQSCGGYSETPGKVLMGGPMMGVALCSMDTPIIKNSNAILSFGKDMAGLPVETACIRCGRCVKNCPMSLLPLQLNRTVVNESWEEFEKYHVMDCIECGCCSYVCPSKRYLVQSIRLGKEYLKKNPAKPVAASK